MRIKIGTSGGSSYYYADTKMTLKDTDKQSIMFIFFAYPSGSKVFSVIANYQYKTYIVKEL